MGATTKQPGNVSETSTKKVISLEQQAVANSCVMRIASSTESKIWDFGAVEDSTESLSEMITSSSIVALSAQNTFKKQSRSKNAVPALPLTSLSCGLFCLL